MDSLIKAPIVPSVRKARVKARVYYSGETGKLVALDKVADPHLLRNGR
jgi:hypothetical protein